LKGKAVRIQAWTGCEDYSRLRLPDIETICTWRWPGCQPYVLAALTPRMYSWDVFLL